MSKFYTVEKEIKGKKYKAQFSGISTALRAVDESYIDGTANTSTDKLSRFLFEHIIVEPKGLTADDFDTLEEFNEVTEFAREVMGGGFRDTKEDKDAANRKGK